MNYVKVEVPSATSPKSYTVTLNPPSCLDADGLPCEFRKHYPGRPCRHILEAINKQLKDRCKYLEGRALLDYSEEWDTFEQVIAAFEWGHGEEFNYICNLIMALALSYGEVNGDQVAWSLNQEYTPGGNKRLSAAWGALGRKGMIQRVGTKTSERPQNHGSDMGVYILTDAGKKLMEPLLKHSF
jgi:hypothetical protein